MEIDYNKLEKFGITNDGKTEKISPAPQISQKLIPKEHKRPPRLTNAEPLDENMKQWFAGRGIPDEEPKWDNSNWLAKKQPEQGELGLV